MSAIPLETGTRCLLVVMNRRYMVSILQVSLETFRVTFPTVDFPIAGMTVELEVHDEHGYTAYVSEVVETPTVKGDGLLLRAPESTSRSDHRGFWRVSGDDIQVELKSHVHPRRYEVKVLDIGAGGMLISTRAPVEAGENVDLLLRLPGASPETLGAKIVHLPEGKGGGRSAVLIGLRFYNPDPVVIKAVSRYIWQRVKTLRNGEITAPGSGGT